MNALVFVVVSSLPHMEIKKGSTAAIAATSRIDSEVAADGSIKECTD